MIRFLIRLALRLASRHGKCTLTPKNAPIRCPIVAFYYRYEMSIVSFIHVLLHSFLHVLSNKRYGVVKNCKTQNYKHVINCHRSGGSNMDNSR